MPASSLAGWVERSGSRRNQAHPPAFVTLAHSYVVFSNHVSLPELPIHAVLPELRRSLATHTRLVLEAPPGAGKTTQVPPALLDSP
ncbi:MAG: hypothetical protein WBW61_05840, partial [Rhodanobacteraceae bacterium]